MNTNHVQTKKHEPKKSSWKQAYLLPKTLQELQLKRPGNYSLEERHANFSSGLPDYAQALLSGWFAHRNVEPIAAFACSKRIENLYNLCSRNDSLITTTFHSIHPVEEGNAKPAVQITTDGIWLSGKQTFASDALYADELLVFVQEKDETNPSTVVLIPTNSSDLRLPLEAAAYANVTVSYDRLFVPWERVISLQNQSEVDLLLGHPELKSLADYQWVSRQADLIELVTATAVALAEKTGRHKELHIQGLLGELLQNLDTIKAFIHAAEINAYFSQEGICLPSAVPLGAAKKAGGTFYKADAEALLRIGNGDIGFEAHSADEPLRHLVRTFAGSEEAVNRRQHEEFAFGDPIRLSTELYRVYPQEKLVNRYEAFWRERSER